MRCLRCGDAVRIQGRGYVERSDLHLGRTVVECGSCSFQWAGRYKLYYIDSSSENLVYRMPGARSMFVVPSGCLGVFNEEDEG